MNNNKATGKYIIVKDLDFNDYMKDLSGELRLYDTLDEACETCGMYEFKDVLVMKVEFNHVEDED